MNDASSLVRDFFDAYVKATESLDLGFFESAYAETFMFGGPNGVQAIKREDFLKVVPRRKAFFKTIGLVSSQIRALEERFLDSHYTMIKTFWTMRFEKEAGHSIADESSATYILRVDGGALQIVFQLDHQDLTKRSSESTEVLFRSFFSLITRT